MKTFWAPSQTDPRTRPIPAQADRRGPPGIGLVRQEREDRKHEGLLLSLGNQRQDEDRGPSGVSASGSNSAGAAERHEQ